MTAYLRTLKRRKEADKDMIACCVVTAGLLSVVRKAECEEGLDVICPLCKLEAQDEAHLVWRCPVVQGHQMASCLRSVGLKREAAAGAWLPLHRRLGRAGNPSPALEELSLIHI